MKKAFLTFSFLFLIAFVTTSCETQPKELKNTTIAFNKEIHDFKKLPRKIPAKTTFQFTNTGEHDLLIQDVKTSCGCTVPEWTKERIAPNQSGEIKIEYDAKYPGRFNKTITVTYNGENAPKKLVIKGEVEYPEDIE